MAVLNIIKAGDPVLKATAKPVTKVNKHIKKLLDDMAETMYAAEGVGLAAPQVNESLQLIVLDDGHGLIELINPEILEKSDETNVDTEHPRILRQGRTGFENQGPFPDAPWQDGHL